MGVGPARGEEQGGGYNITPPGLNMRLGLLLCKSHVPRSSSIPPHLTPRQRQGQPKADPPKHRGRGGWGTAHPRAQSPCTSPAACAEGSGGVGAQ